MEGAELDARIRAAIDRSELGLLVRQLGGWLRIGTGTPEGVVTAPIGTLFLRRDGGAVTSLYVKESGTGKTGWVAK